MKVVPLNIGIQIDCDIRNLTEQDYKDINDLSDKIKFYSLNDILRKKIAENGKKKYFQLFNEKIITKYLVEKSLGSDVVLY